jgi:hypothetical protein
MGVDPLSDSRVEGVRAIQSCTRANHPVATQHARLDKLAAGYAYDHRDYPVMREIHVGNAVVCPKEGCSPREIKWRQMGLNQVAILRGKAPKENDLEYL